MRDISYFDVPVLVLRRADGGSRRPLDAVHPVRPLSAAKTLVARRYLPFLAGGTTLPSSVSRMPCFQRHFLIRRK